MRVVIAVTVGGDTSVLMDGVMTHHEMRPGTSGGRGSLVVKGKDLTHVMDLLELDGLPYPAMPSSLRVLTSLAKYAAFGVVPMVIDRLPCATAQGPSVTAWFSTTEPVRALMTTLADGDMVSS